MTSESENAANPLLDWPLEHLMGLYQLNQALFTLIRLELFEHLAQHPAQSLAQLAEQLAVDARLLEHLLQIAVELGVLSQDEGKSYTLSDKGKRLCADAPDSLIPGLSFADDAYHPWGGLQQSLQGGQSAFFQMYGMNFYQYARQHPEKNQHFNRYMAQTTEKWLADARGHYPFAGHLVDMGGNNGAFTALVLQHHPELTATLFDLEQALIEADEVLTKAGVRQRCHIVAGDFFQSDTIPANGDIYLFSRVLFNWSDEEVVQILRHCRQAMADHAKLLILEFIRPDQPTLPDWLGSLNLWVMFGARERTQSDYEALLREAGFEPQQWLPCPNEAMNLLFLEARVARYDDTNEGV